MTLYLITAFNTDESTVNMVYAFISITSPISGILLGGMLTNKLGGYESNLVTYQLFIVSALVKLS